MKFLIVEDDFTARKHLQIHLSQFGDCFIAVNGEEAIHAVKEALAEGEPYDLICLDIMMPGIDGHKTLETIRWLEEKHSVGRERGAKVIMTTAMADAEHLAEAFKEGCEAYLQKPIKKEQLLKEMEKLGLIQAGATK